MNQIVRGGDVMVFVGGKSIAFATNHSLSISGETKETSTKDSGGKWATSEMGILSWTANSENMVADTGAGSTFQDIFNLMIARQPVDIVFAYEGNSTNYAEGKLDTVPTSGWTPKANHGYKGKALITALNQNAPNNDNATFTVDFTGVGALEPVSGAAKASLYDED